MKNKIVFIIFAFIFVSSLHADNTNKYLDKMSSVLKNVKTLQFDFEQKILLLNTLEESEIKGQLLVKTYTKDPINCRDARPGVSCDSRSFKKNRLSNIKFYLKNTSPFKQDIVSNGSKIWIYTHENKQLMINSMNNFDYSNNLFSVLDFLIYFNETRDKVEFFLLSDNKKTFKLSLRDKEKNSTCKLIVSKKNYLPIVIESIDEASKVIVSLRKMVINKEFSDLRFEFKAPAGIEVWEMEE